MKIFLPACLFFIISLSCKAQTDSSALLTEATTKLKNKSATVSVILTDKKYLTIHPATPFRQLIEANATTEIIQITTTSEPGKKIRVLGVVTDKNGKPVAGALVYLYQTDSRGWYAADAPHVLSNEGDMRHARLFGYVKTDAGGKFELHTVKPSGYPRSDLPAHIHVHVTAAGFKSYVTEFLFDDDERLVGNIREQSARNQFLISTPEKATAAFDQQFSYKVLLEKE
jgi:protocatechuate 3,4-dioxygenase beta subunit